MNSISIHLEFKVNILRYRSFASQGIKLHRKKPIERKFPRMGINDLMLKIKPIIGCRAEVYPHSGKWSFFY
jgi:hypothetical protein